MAENLLLLEASTLFSYAAYFDNKNNSWSKKSEILISLAEQKIFGKAQNTLSLNGDQWLSELIRYLLIKEKSKRFNYIVLGKGPGFFTSLRVAHTTCATLALLWESKTIHFPSLLFWREFFDIKNKALFALRVNQNLYYVDTGESKTGSFTVMTTHQLIEFSEKNINKEIFLWQEPWQKRTVKKNNQNKIIERNRAISEIFKNSSKIKELSLEKKFKVKKKFIPIFLKENNIKNMQVEIQDFLPIYGHTIF